jgi:hypothetical protein
MVVLAARRVSGDDRLGLEDALVVDVPRLDPLALGEVVRSQLAVRLSAPLVSRLGDVSGGNPFVALEVAREIAALPAPVRDTDPLPVPDDGAWQITGGTGAYAGLQGTGTSSAVADFTDAFAGTGPVTVVHVETGNVHWREGT